MENNKNKIDAVIDEVLESKRLNQGVQLAKKGLVFSVGIGIIIFIFVVIFVALGIIK